MIQKLQVKDLDINNKNSAVREGLREIDEHVFQPTWDQLGGLLIDPVANAYIEFVEEQAKGKYQPLPQWLKLILSEDNPYDIDLSRVSYVEGINTLQADNVITFGYKSNKRNSASSFWKTRYRRRISLTSARSGSNARRRSPWANSSTARTNGHR